MSAVLITGASGFIGSNLRDRLAAAEPVAAPRFAGLERLFEEHRFTHVYHLAAAAVRADEDHSDEAVECNTLRTFQLARLALRYGVKRFIYVGSGFEYREQPRPIDEFAPLSASNLYGASKIAGWMLLDYLCREEGLPLVTLRPFAIYGPGEHASKLIPYVSSSALRRRRMQLTGGDQVRDYIYVEDAIDGLIAAGRCDGCIGRVYNLGAGPENAKPVRAIVEQILHLAGAPLSLCEFGKAERTRRDPAYLVADASRAGAELGWRPKVDLQDGLIATLVSVA